MSAAAAVTDKAQVEGWLVGQEGTRLELPPIDGNHLPANQRPTPSLRTCPLSKWTAFHIPTQFYSNQKRPLRSLARPPLLPNYVSGRLSIFKPKITMERERATFAARTRGEKIRSGIRIVPLVLEGWRREALPRRGR